MLTLILSFLAFLHLPQATQEPAGPRQAEATFQCIPLQHASAAEVLQTLSALLDPHEQVLPDARTNSLIIQASVPRMSRIGEWIKLLDQPANPDAVELTAGTGQPLESLFLPVTRDLVFEPDASGQALTLSTMLRQYERVTGQVLLISEQEREVLDRQNAGFHLAVSVPAASAQSFVEHVLLASGFFLMPCPETQPRLIEVVYARSREQSKLALRGVLVESSSVAALSLAHPALYVRCVVSLQTDARQLANAMRTLLPDLFAVSLMPAGTSNSMIVTGSAQAVADLVGVLQVVSEQASASPSATAAQPAQ